MEQNDIIVSDTFYNAVPAFEKPMLTEVAETMRQAEGSPLPALGSTQVEIKLGSCKMEMPVTVAKFKEDVLLGMHFFEMTGSHVDVQNRELLINGEVVLCRDSAGRGVLL